MKKLFITYGIGIFAAVIIIGAIPMSQYYTAAVNFIWSKTHLAPVAIFLNPNDAKLRFAIGNYYFSGGAYDLKKAEASFKKAVEINEKIPGVHYQLARIYFLEGNFNDAIFEIGKEISLNPNFKKSYYIKGLILGYRGNFDGAIENLKKFQSFDSFNWAGWNDLSWAYFQKGDYKNAKNTAEEGLKRAEGNPWLLNSLGVTLMNLGDKNGAKDAFTEALSALTAMTPEDWGRAYPGNDPKIYKIGLEKTKESIEFNLNLLPP